MDIELIAPRADLHGEWLGNAAEWGGVTHHPGSGNALARDLNLHEAIDFAVWVDRLTANTTVVRSGDLVPATNRWIVRGDRYLGAIQLRHELTEVLAELGGHIGYHVRPSERRKGVASTALALMIAEAARVGLPEVLVTCDENNLASRRTAESAGGVLTRIRPVDDYAVGHGFPEPTCHYWIPTAATRSATPARSKGGG
ncbi:GCN5-related N-acetyltransferase OS=Tsukamurella paurometabola (strain ATCC 8368 / DSM / CCUG 35730 / CIP 100753 / JCM 10117 / KCTC 9821 / NBRC 16120 /NCIMB 702349 / NCTC 13040) OX=521096 GN=Tpau_1691 PE=4 SV=1 [Tsukamurella paurometabola]|uniref:GCN5-related N-acetyltransferase n=1 Tax=Tsukamurella paurometabola (strain ATCC 8368 / DSM 20162 / CCUG 35730 / CIP 100753 / JCM 10117 / KCTC 9821 / NBRC 16120 / NCIMB 702349 / NCTC 13040) TaxID=521096 RepID=D5UM29_TSUPD|nr:GNAT family N-acetyltransferase [Tsukamurella paurometabola]ADG78309.1 GCN5-related N-acetyltransferase [Tsukamurella paurometabola DSM 20162]SUP31151.1 Predicted acetyltransferase [Tsukamurella paurometabola]